MIKKKFIIKKLFLIIFTIFLTQFYMLECFSLEPEEILQNEKQETRARIISKNVRCMVCQNQSIDDSNAPLAKDLRILIRNKIKEGKTNKEIYKFLSDRYGDFILLKPPLKSNTFVLWFLPGIFFIVGFYIFLKYKKKSE
tara:strand:- start:260 stop:679 length:420 start_codon:yes stop_codon:yes gene_type:complete